jgi:hypothetical protein
MTYAIALVLTMFACGHAAPAMRWPICYMGHRGQSSGCLRQHAPPGTRWRPSVLTPTIPAARRFEPCGE